MLVKFECVFRLHNYFIINLLEIITVSLDINILTDADHLKPWNLLSNRASITFFI